MMADLQTRQKAGSVKRILPRIDMTPMVDLGFLLISFFMFTTTLTQPRALEVNMPYRNEKAPDNGTSYPEESTTTLILFKKHSIIYYHGMFDSGKIPTRSDFQGIRPVLIDKQKEAAALPPSFSRQAHFLHVLIKPTDDCTYEDVVKALDEMSILDVRYYALVDISAEEKEWLQQQGPGSTTLSGKRGSVVEPSRNTGKD